MSPTVEDLLGFVLNPAPGDPSMTAGADQLPNTVDGSRQLVAAPTGITAIDTATIRAAATAALATGKSLWFREGNYSFDSTQPLSGFTNLAMYGPNKGTATITLVGSGYFVDDNQAWGTAQIIGLTFTGSTPAGFFRNRFSGINVNGLKVVRDCQFFNHQVCAISSNATDEPFWIIEDNQFQTANVTTAIDIALAGQADGCAIQRNSFNGARVNVKYRRPYTVKHVDNSHVPFFAQSGGVQRARVWIVPNDASGAQGARIVGNKMGNETIGAGDLHILIAGELAGTWVGDMQPDLATAQTNAVIGMEVSGQFFGNATAAPPIIYTMTPKIYGSTITGVGVGTSPSYLIQFATAPAAADYLADTNQLGWIPPSSNTPLPLHSNALSLYGHLNDPAGVFVPDPLTPQQGSGDVGELIDISPVKAPSWNTSLASIAGIADRLAGADAIEANITSNGGLVYAYIQAPTIGMPAWVEFDMKVGSATPLATVVLLVGQDTFQSGGAVNLKRWIVPQAGWQRYRLPLAFTTAGANIIVCVQSPNATGKVQIGRTKVYHARSPLQLPPPTNQPLAYSASVTPNALVPWQTITVTNATAFTINAPPNPSIAQPTTELTIEVLNSSGGAMGAITWNATYIFPTGAWANPASTKKRFARFEYNGTNWICTSLATADY